jgi:hypothetical protein
VIEQVFDTCNGVSKSGKPTRFVISSDLLIFSRGLPFLPTTHTCHLALDSLDYIFALTVQAVTLLQACNSSSVSVQS